MHAPQDPRACPIDLEHLNRFTCGDKSLEREILSLFVVHSPECLAALLGAATQAQWIAAAHSLKGSARAVGAVEVAELAAAAERMVPADAAQRHAQVALLRTALEAVRVFVCGLNDQVKRSAAS
jgi:HPt (histidine-containing phosphotransfer) domain-containing protein